MNIEENVSLKSYNTFGLDAKASIFVQPKDEKEVSKLLQGGLLASERFFILGGGSNIVFVAEFAGVVVRMANKGISIVSEDDRRVVVEAQAGEVWSDFAWDMTRRGFYGLENLVEIPGCVGAAPVQNVGAYGVEAKDVIKAVVAYEIATGCKRIFTNTDCKFGYRDSVFKNELKDKYIVFSVMFELHKEGTCTKTDYSAISNGLKERNILSPTPMQVAEVVADIRKQKLPDTKEIGSAGSFFKNPIVGEQKLELLMKDYPTIVHYASGDGKYKLAAAWLIEQCGWKGKSLGRVGVYAKQALVLVNNGGCTGSEVQKLSETIVADVENKFGVRLETEAIIVK